MSSLKQIIDTKNKWVATHNGKQYNIENLQDSDIKSLLGQIEDALSPENLSCDGELNSKEINTKYNSLYSAGQELMVIAKQRGLNFKIYALE